LSWIFLDYFSDTNTSTYAVPDALFSPLHKIQNNRFIDIPPVVTPVSSYSSSPFNSLQQNPLPHPRAVYASLKGLQGHCGSSLYAVPVDLTYSGQRRDNIQIDEIFPEDLKFVKKLGEGVFGEVSEQ